MGTRLDKQRSWPPFGFPRAVAVRLYARQVLLGGIIIGPLLTAAGLIAGRFIPLDLAQIDPWTLPVSLAIVVSASAAAGGVVANVGLRYCRTIQTSTLVDGTPIALCAVSLAVSIGLARLLGLQVHPTVLVIAPSATAFGAVALIIGAALSQVPPTRREAPEPVPNSTARTLLTDAPINGPDEDALHRDGLVSVLLSLLRDQRNRRESLVIALDGAWGSGKSSILRLLETQLEATEQSNYVVIRFDPWDYDKPATLLSAFLASLSDAINRRFFLPQIEREAHRYVAALNPALGRFGITVDPFRRRDVDVSRRALNSLTRNLGSHIVILLDDLDRLAKDDFLATLRLIKLSADLENVTYIVALDVAQIRDRMSADLGTDFLVKFLDVVVPVGLIDTDDIYRFTKQALERLIVDGRYANHVDASGLDAIIREHMHALSTLRDAKRAFNGFTVALTQLVGEVSVKDLWLLETLRSRAPTLWLTIYRSPRFFIYAPERTSAGEIGRLLLLSAADEHEAWQAERAKFYDQIRSQVPAGIWDIVTTLFPYAGARDGQPQTTERDIREQRVRAEPYFRRYYLARLSEGMAPDTPIDEFVSQLSSLTGTNTDVLDQEVTERLARLLAAGREYAGWGMHVVARVTLHATRLGPDVLPALARATVRLAGVITAEKDSRVSNWEALSNALINLISHIPKKCDVRGLITETVAGAPDLALAAYVAYYARPVLAHLRADIAASDDTESFRVAFNSRIERELGLDKATLDVDLNDVRDLFQDYADTWSLILSVWNNLEKKSLYLEHICSRCPEHFEQLITRYVGTSPDTNLPVVATDTVNKDWSSPLRVCALASLLAPRIATEAGKERLRMLQAQLCADRDSAA